MARSVEEIIDEIGFEYKGTCPASKLRTTEDVRGMCAANKCGFYDKNWQCPPACGGIDEWQQRFANMDTCYVFQTWGGLEDEFDFETMAESGELQKDRVLALVEALDAAGLSADTMVLSAGTCTLCKECTYPDAPCRFPNKRLVSMEAAGLVVSEVCEMAGIPYNHGELTMCYSGCVLYN